MGFFSKIRKRIKKIIPKEIRPFVPYAAALIPGGPFAAGGLGASLGGNQFLKAALARGLTDDEASIKDIARAGIFAAAPTALDTGIGALDSTQGIGKFLTTAGKGKDATSIAEKVSRFADPSGMDAVYAVGGAGAIDAGIKAAELNEDALDEYNRMLAEQGIADKAGRRAAIRKIYENTGTWDMDEVDEMLDTYGYRTGGRVRHAVGDMVTADSEEVISEVSPTQQDQIQSQQMIDEAYQQIFQKFVDKFPGIATGEETIEEMIAMLQAENVMETPGLGILGADAAMDMITPESAGASARRIMMGDTQYGDFSDPDYPTGMPGGYVDQSGMPGGYNNGGRIGYDEGDVVGQPPIHKKYKNKKGKKWDSKKERWVDSDKGEDFFDSLEAAKEGYDKLEEQNTIKPLPIRELRLARGGDVDDEVMEFDEEIITPEYLMKEEGVEIGEQVSSPDRMDELNSLSMDLFGKPLGELSEIQMEMLMNYASQQASGYSQDELDMYEQYKYDMNEQRPGMPIMSIDEYLQMELGAARMGVKKGGKVIKIMPEGVLYKGKAKDYPGIKQLIKDMKKKGTRPKKAEGGLMNLGGNEMDLRGGGFVPLGAEERADDVPARLSKNEFVMTADAVRGAGGGSVQKGADLMYDQMKTLEAKA